MANRARLVAACVAALIATGCVSLTMTEEAQWGELLNDDIVDEPLPHKNVWAAGILDFIIPGFGHFYLGEWGSGSGLFLSNVLWPLSPFWAAPAAVKDTDTVNKRYTVEYYYFGPGREVIAEKQRDKVFQKAKEYVTFQGQAGRANLTRKEITDFLFMQDFKSEHILDLDWYELERRTGAAVADSVHPEVEEPQFETIDDTETTETPRPVGAGAQR